MVGCGHTIVDVRIVWLKVVRTEYVIYSEVHPTTMIADPRTITTRYKAIYQFLVYDSMGVT